jgi:hypothetical protein
MIFNKYVMLQIKAHAEQYQKCINLNSVALCFQGFIKDEYDVIRPITVPVYSNPINNLSKFQNILILMLNLN